MNAFGGTDDITVERCAPSLRQLTTLCVSCFDGGDNLFNYFFAFLSDAIY